MENNRNITISLETAKEWYKGCNEVLKKLALQVFTETGAFYVVGKTEKEAVIKIYNLLKEKNAI